MIDLWKTCFPLLFGSALWIGVTPKKCALLVREMTKTKRKNFLLQKQIFFFRWIFAAKKDDYLSVIKKRKAGWGKAIFFLGFFLTIMFTNFLDCFHTEYKRIFCAFIAELFLRFPNVVTKMVRKCVGISQKLNNSKEKW